MSRFILLTRLEKQNKDFFGKMLQIKDVTTLSDTLILLLLILMMLLL